MNKFSAALTSCGLRYSRSGCGQIKKEIIAYLQEGAGSNETETPEAGKFAFQSKPTTVFTRDQIKIRLADGTIVAPQAGIAVPVTITGKVGITDGNDICTINAVKVEKR